MFTKLIPVVFRVWLAGAMVACWWWVEDWIATVAVEPIVSCLDFAPGLARCWGLGTVLEEVPTPVPKQR